MTIDIHTHIFPDALALRAVGLLAARANVPAYTDGTYVGLTASMRRAGIDLSVVAPVATKPVQVSSINTWSIEMNRSRADIICFGAIHPMQEDWAAEIDCLVAAGIAGVKMHPDYQEFYVNDPRVLPIYRALASSGRILILHAGADFGLPPPVHNPPELLARILDDVPELTIIAAHMGGYLHWEGVHRLLAGRNLYLDTSYSMEYLGSERMADLIRAHGAARVLFGTDSPWKDQATEVAGIRKLPLTAAEKEAVLGQNAEKLLAGYLNR